MPPHHQSLTSDPLGPPRASAALSSFQSIIFWTWISLLHICMIESSSQASYNSWSFTLPCVTFIILERCHTAQSIHGIIRPPPLLHSLPPRRRPAVQTALAAPCPPSVLRRLGSPECSSIHTNQGRPSSHRQSTTALTTSCKTQMPRMMTLRSRTSPSTMCLSMTVTSTPQPRAVPTML